MEVNNQIPETVPGGMPVGTGVAVQRASQIPMEVGEAMTLENKKGVHRDVPRYVVLAGDLMPDATKRNFRGIQGYQIGGRWFDLTDVPCLWKFSGFVTRGRITPLIKRPVKAFQAEEIYKKKAEETAVLTEATGQAHDMPDVYRMSFPWDSLQTIVGPAFGPQGFVEVECLRGVAWEERIVQQIQQFFFPNWDEILVARAELPILIRDFEQHIRSRMQSTSDDTLVEAGGAYLTSADRFRIHAQEVVDKAREATARGMNDKGYLAYISPFARHLAVQLGIDIEIKQQVSVNVQGGAPAAAPTHRLSESEFGLEMRKLAAQEETNRLKAIELGLDKPQPPEVTETTSSMPVPASPASGAADETDRTPAASTTVHCAATKKDGSECKGMPVNGSEFCSFHQPKDE